MSCSDPIADLLTRIRNGLNAQHRFVDIGWSKMKEELARIFKEQGFIESYLVKRERSIGTIRIFLKYAKNRQPVIQGIVRISKPGARNYVGYKDMRPVYGGMGVTILSTSRGVMSSHDAREQKVGGEQLCKIW